MRIKKKIFTLAGNRILDFKTLWSWYREKTNRQEQRAQETHTHGALGNGRGGTAGHSKRKEYKVNGARKMRDTLGMRTLYSCLTLSSNSTSHQKELNVRCQA